jgi:hypothetical protein
VHSLLIDFVRSLLVGFGVVKGGPTAYTETELWEIAEGRRLHSATKSTLALFAVWISIHLIFGWTNHWSFYLILAIAALGHYFHCRLKALCQVLGGEREGRASQHGLEPSSQSSS